ncbi:MAG: BON domain-containing protein [Bryobacteraceae bacterium]|jgi:osmotically-inducible protein OsmY
MRILAAVLLLTPLALIAHGSSATATLGLDAGLAFAGDKYKTPVTDDSIRDQVMMRLAGDQEVKGGAIDVQVTDGVVTLKGPVDSDKARQKAERLSKHVKGVKSVVNQLTVKE